MATLFVHQVGPGVTIQDLGRPGWKAEGLSTGGAADRLALFEATALLRSNAGNAVLEMMGFGGTFSTDQDTRIALTGAAMTAHIDGTPVPPNTSALLRAGSRLSIGGAKRGVYGYLAFAGGIATDTVMDSRATHLTAGIGATLQANDRLPLGRDPNPQDGPRKITVENRFDGGVLRVMSGPQTDFFSSETRDRFEATTFTRSPRGNRQGVQLNYEGTGFPTEGSLTLVSDLIVPGDIQMTGDGVPYVLLAECQTIGGYPRMGSVLPTDLPKVAQAAPGTKLHFRFVDLPTADATAVTDKALLAQLAAKCTPLIRDPHDIPDLAGYQLISGMISGEDVEGSRHGTDD